MDITSLDLINIGEDVLKFNHIAFCTWGFKKDMYLDTKIPSEKLFQLRVHVNIKLSWWIWLVLQTFKIVFDVFLPTLLSKIFEAKRKMQNQPFKLCIFIYHHKPKLDLLWRISGISVSLWTFQAWITDTGRSDTMNHQLYQRMQPGPNPHPPPHGWPHPRDINNDGDVSSE